MDCGTCGSQDTTIKRGISKKTGKPYVGYTCNEPTCVNDKGYPNMTFAPAPRGPQNAPKAANPTPRTTGLDPNIAINKKLDRILAILADNFGEAPIERKPEDDSTPF